MQTTSSKDQDHGAAASPAATELARHYGEHGRPATANAGPAALDSAREAANRAGEQAASATATAGEMAGDIVNRAREQAAPAIARITETAQDLAHRAREQAGPAAHAVYDQGARAGQYVTRNLHDYPATALLIAAAIGYGLAWLVHGGGWSWGTGHNRYDRGSR